MLLSRLIEVSQSTGQDFYHLLYGQIEPHSTNTGYMPIEWMLGQKPIVHVEDYIPTWLVLNWEDGITRERLLEL